MSTTFNIKFENGTAKVVVNREMTASEKADFLEQFQPPLLEILGLTAVGMQHIPMCYGE